MVACDNHLDLKYSKIKSIRKTIISVMADIEATIDYPEYDLEEVTNSTKANSKIPLQQQVL